MTRRVQNEKSKKVITTMQPGCEYTTKDLANLTSLTKSELSGVMNKLHKSGHVIKIGSKNGVSIWSLK